jgi:hypothetical protein
VTAKQAKSAQQEKSAQQAKSAPTSAKTTNNRTSTTPTGVLAKRRATGGTVKVATVKVAKPYRLPPTTFNSRKSGRK